MMASEPSPPAPSDGRGERLHPATLLFASTSIGRAFLLPAVVGGVSVGAGDFGRVITWILAFLAVPALLAATARYLSFRYRLTDEELILDSGVLSRRRRVIPIARVQNIDTRQSPLQRLLRVAELRVETAGGERTEAVLEVLATDHAESLRRALLARRRRLYRAVGDAEAGGPAGIAAERLARLSTGDLALAGATANEAGLIAAILASGLQALQQLPFQIVPEPWLDPEPLAQRLAATGLLVLILAVVVLFLVLGWLFSILGAIVRYHGFVLELVGDELRKRYGLLSRRHAAIPLERVQAVRVEESLLRRPLGLAVLKVATAGTGPGERQRAGAEAFLPLARSQDVPRLVAAVFPELELGSLRFRPVHLRARRRAFVRYALGLAAVVILLAGAVRTEALGLLLLVPATYGAAHLHYRHLAYALAPGFVIARAGFWNRITWIVPDWKIQTAHLAESPLQRRHGLGTIVVDTAAGGTLQEARVRDLGRTEALRLLAELADRAASTRS